MLWNTLGLWQEIQTGLGKGSATGKIASIGVDTWGVDYVLLDQRGRQVAPCYHYRDERTRGILQKAFSLVSREEIFAATGLQFMEFNSAFQLLAARLEGDRSLEIASRMLMMPDYFHWLLTGIESNEYTNASTSQLLDPRTGAWRVDLIDRLGIPQHLFLPPSRPGTVLGCVSGDLATELKLDRVPVILPATHDTGSAVLAVPAEDFAPEKPTWCYVSSGTWSLMGCELPTPRVNATCARLNFTNEGGVQGSTRLLKNIGGLWLFQQCRKALLKRGISMSWEEMLEAASRGQPLRLLIDPDAPDFVAPRDMLDAIAEYARRTDQPPTDDVGTLLRATLEGLALRYRDCLHWLEELTETTMKTIHIVGGGSQNKMLCQMTADACGRTVVAGPVEGTAIGNVLMQMIGLGIIRSVQEARSIIRESFGVIVYQPRDEAAWSQAQLA
jgi:rhamnulokinase